MSSAGIVGRVVELVAQDGHRLDAYFIEPTSPVKGGVVVLQEAFGVNDHIRAVCDQYASHGYAAIAPALYDRQARGSAFGYDQDSMEKARALRRSLNYDLALHDVAAAVDRLRPFGSVAVVGYCVGGSAAWLAACRLNVAAAVCYYPSDLAKQIDEHPRHPVLMHFAGSDRFIPADVVERFQAVHPQVPVHVYPADHGFNCWHRTHGYDAASADLALERTLRFIGDASPAPRAG